MELYVHIPFCIQKCNYCDFLSFPHCTEAQMKNYVDALLEELEHYSGELKRSGEIIDTIFIGGGTPSVLSAYDSERLLKVINTMPLADAPEFTIECNPGTLTEELLKVYTEYGVNRISLGLQSTDNERLKLLGRIHSFEQFKESYRLVRKAGIQNVNVDLISGLPGENAESFEQELKTVFELSPEHISVYSLIIEEGTPFYDMELELPSEEEDRRIYRRTRELMEENGYTRYEISNYSRPGYESRHNMGYWTGEKYLGVGLGASSYLPEADCSKAVRLKNTADIEAYIKAPYSSAYTEEELDIEGLMSEYMILHLRLTHGADLREFYERFGIKAEERYSAVLEKYKRTGHLIIEGSRLFLSENGIDISNVIMAEFL